MQILRLLTICWITFLSAAAVAEEPSLYFSAFEASVVGLDTYYKEELRKIYDDQTKKDLDSWVVDVKAIIEVGKKHVADARAGRVDILTDAGRTAFLNRVQINAKAAQASVVMLTNILTALTTDDQIRHWFASLDGIGQFEWSRVKTTIRNAMKKWAFETTATGIQTLRSKFEAEQDTSRLEKVFAQALAENKAHEKAIEGHWTQVKAQARAKLAVAIAGAFVSGAQAARSLRAALGAGSNITKAFSGAGAGQVGQLAFAGAPAGSGFAGIGQIVVGGAATVDVVLVAELLTVATVRAVSAIQIGAVAMAMVGTPTGGGGIPSKQLQPVQGGDPKFPRNSDGADYPDLKYPQEYPKAGQRMEFPDGELQIVAKANRDTWGVGLGDKRGAGPIGSKAEYIQEWYKRGNKTPPGGWEGVEIHHILPREYGGRNVFENLIPLKKEIHAEVTKWWAAWKPLF